MALPEIVLPAWAGKIGGKLPGRPPRFALVFALNTMLKRGLLHRPIHIISANMHSVMNSLFAEKALAGEVEKHTQ